MSLADTASHRFSEMSAPQAPEDDPAPRKRGRHLDGLDRKILRVVQEDATLSVADIGEKVGLSATPCWQRIRKLERDRIILRRVALVDQRKIGIEVMAYVMVRTGDHSYNWLKQFSKAVRAIPEVIELYRMAGDVDYLLRVAAPHQAAVDTSLGRIKIIPGIIDVTTRVITSALVHKTALPIQTLHPVRAAASRTP